MLPCSPLNPNPPASLCSQIKPSHHLCTPNRPLLTFTPQTSLGSPQLPLLTSTLTPSSSLHSATFFPQQSKDCSPAGVHEAMGSADQGSSHMISLAWLVDCWLAARWRPAAKNSDQACKHNGGGRSIGTKALTRIYSTHALSVLRSPPPCMKTSGARVPPAPSHVSGTARDCYQVKLRCLHFVFKKLIDILMITELH